jgi:hypothetical protein
MIKIAYFAPHLERFQLSNGDEYVYEKELIYCGEFLNGDKRFKITPSLLQHWVETHDKLNSNGIDVPVPVEHTNDPEKVRGQLLALSLRTNARGVLALYGKIKFRDAEAAKLALTSDVSVYSPKEYTDGLGRTYTQPIRHVALTCYPVVPKLDRFQAIAASFNEERPMPWTKIANRLDVNVSDMEDDAAEEAVLAGVDALIEERDTLQAEVDRLLAILAEHNINPDGTSNEEDDDTEVSASLVNLMVDNRTMKIDDLVKAGKVTAALAKDLRQKHTSKQAVTMALSQKNGTAAFDSLIDTLRSNEPIISFRERTQAQSMELSHGDKKGSLAANAKKRAKSRR